MTRDYRKFVANPVRERIFPERIGRSEYLARSLILNLGMLLFLLPLDLVHDLGKVTWGGLFYMLAVGLFGLVLILWGAVFPRMRDLMWNTRWAWILLCVPGVNLIVVFVLLFAPTPPVSPSVFLIGNSGNQERK